jgi:aspartate racemase
VSPATGQRPCIGVIGGMGPAATADMLRKLIAATGAGRDEDHLRILVDCDPGIPSPTKHILGLGPSPVRPLLGAARTLAGQGADALLMACNTAHAFYAPVAACAGVPVVHFMRATADWLRAEHPQVRTVGVLATTGCVRAGLYQDALRQAGLHPVVPGAADQRLVQRAIAEPDGIKAGHLDQPRRWLAQVAQRLAERGCDAVVAGCTEVPLALDQGWLRPLFVDATAVAAAAAVRLVQSAPQRRYQHAM